jgi:hypothetical protein
MKEWAAMRQKVAAALAKCAFYVNSPAQTTFTRRMSKA